MKSKNNYFPNTESLIDLDIFIGVYPENKDSVISDLNEIIKYLHPLDLRIVSVTENPDCDYGCEIVLKGSPFGYSQLYNITAGNEKIQSIEFFE